MVKECKFDYQTHVTVEVQTTIFLLAMKYMASMQNLVCKICYVNWTSGFCAIIPAPFVTPCGKYPQYGHSFEVSFMYGWLYEYVVAKCQNTSWSGVLKIKSKKVQFTVLIKKY